MKYFSFGIQKCWLKVDLSYISFFWLRAADSVKYCANKKDLYICLFEGYSRFFSQSAKK